MMDGLAATVWVGITALMFTTAWRVARTIDPTSGQFQRLLHTGLIAWGLLVASTLIIGMTGILVPLAMEGMVIALSLMLQRSAPTLVRWASRTTPTGGSWPYETSTGESGTGTESIYYLWVWGALGIFCLARVIRYGLLEYPSDWDTLNYHLPIIHAWLRAHSLYAPDCQEWFVPGTNEAIGLWLAAPFSGDFLVGLINLPAAFVLGLAVIDLGRQVGLSTPIRHMSGLVAVTAEIVVRQTLTAKNDTAAVALFVASLSYAFRHATGGRRADLWLAATSLGLLTGVKYYAVGYSAVVGTSWVFCRLVVAGWQAAARAGIAGTLGGMALGGYWYGRNILVTGTPFYPKGYFAGTDILSRWRPQGTWGTTLLGNGSSEVFPLLLEAIWKHGGPLHFVTVIFLPGALIWLVGARWWMRHEDGQEGQRLVRTGLAVTVIGAGLIWGIIPFAVEIEPGTLNCLRSGYLPVRFGLCFLTIGLVAVVAAVEDCWSLIRLTHARIMLLTVAVSAAGWHALSILVTHVAGGESMDNLLTAALIGNVVLLKREILRLITPTRRPFLATVGAITVVTPLCVPLAEHWHAKFDQHYTLYMLDKNILVSLHKLNPKKIYYIGYCGYSFAGSYRQTPVCRSLKLSTEFEFLSYIHEHYVSHAVVSHHAANWLGHIERMHEWIQRRPKVFRLVVTDTSHIVYEIDRAALAERVARDRLSGISCIDGPGDCDETGIYDGVRE